MDGISSSMSSNIVSAAMAQKLQNLNVEMGVVTLKKTLDTQSAGMTQLLQQMGIGNNLNAVA